MNRILVNTQDDETTMQRTMKKKKKNSNKNSETVRKTIATELHTPVRRNFARRAVELKGLYELYQADLMEMIPHYTVSKATSI